MTGPTVGVDGVAEWRDAEGRLHREGGPARVFPGGREEWIRHGRLHRDDGPATSYPDGRRIWFEEGVKIKEEREGPPPPNSASAGGEETGDQPGP